jgi:hypothetical protein
MDVDIDMNSPAASIMTSPNNYLKVNKIELNTSAEDELINIFKGALPEEKTKAVETLMLIDPANTTKYLKITG